MAEKKKTRFIRKKGRIIPIRQRDPGGHKKKAAIGVGAGIVAHESRPHIMRVAQKANLKAGQVTPKELKKYARFHKKTYGGLILEDSKAFGGEAGGGDRPFPEHTHRPEHIPPQSLPVHNRP